MDKEGMKKYFGYIGKFTGYAGLGLVGGYLGFTLLLIIREGVQGIILPIVFYFFWLGWWQMLIIVLSIHMLGGILGGVITKKWWGAVIGGFLQTLLAWIIYFYLSY